MARKAKKKPRPGPGRPPLRGVARTGMLSVRIAPDELEALKAHAEARGIPLGALVIEALERRGLLEPPG